MEVIAVGTAAIDVVYEVAMYPEGPFNPLSRQSRHGKEPAHFASIEDSKARSLATYKCRGGNAANALYVVSSLESGSRTIVRYRTIAELMHVAFAQQVERYMTEIRHHANVPVWFHSEGRNVETREADDVAWSNNYSPRKDVA
uniref:Uncharacterized protein n=1 Tax=Peronospora matthiolae TaxID=2874970 RepID=A0AAV1TAE6_9STRA